MLYFLEILFVYINFFKFTLEEKVRQIT